MGYALRKIYPDDINTGIYTFKDYLKLPEGSPYQLIEGELIMSPSPNSYHQTISKNLEFILIGFAKANKSGIVLDAPIDVYIDEKNVFQPDIIFISKENKSILRKKGIVGAPDLVIEILSVSTMGYDEIVKKNIYLEAGVKEYITVNPSEKIIKTYIDKNYLKPDRRVVSDNTDKTGNIVKTGNTRKTKALNKTSVLSSSSSLSLSSSCIQTIETDHSNTAELFINILGLSIPLKDIFEPDSEYQLKDEDGE